MEVAFGRRAVADPAHRDPAVALDRARHRPADRLRELRAEVARDGEEAVRLVRIHDRQLAALQLVALVRVDLAHHLRSADSRARSAGPAGDRSGSSCPRRRARRPRRPRSPPRRCLHVEAGLPLPLGAVHAVVEHAHRDHVAQDLAQGVGVELGVPRADGAMVFVRAPAPGPSSSGGVSAADAATSGLGALPGGWDLRAPKNRACRRAGTWARARAAKAAADSAVLAFLCRAFDERA